MAPDPGGRARLSKTLSRVRAAAAGGDHRGAFAELRDCIRPEADFVDQSRVARCLSVIDLRSIDFRPLRIALLAGSTMEHFVPILRYWLARAGFAAEISIAPFGTAVQTALDPDNALAGGQPDIVWLFSTFRDAVIEVPPGASGAAIDSAVERAVSGRAALWGNLTASLGCTVMDNTADTPGDDVFGNLSGGAPWGSRTVLRRYNAALAAAAPPGVILFDLDHVASLWGKRRWSDPRYWFHSRHAFALDASGLLAHTASRVIAAVRGRSKKCLVLDLDNTLWGGTIGDDGLAGIVLGAGEAGEGFVAFQTFIRSLKERGVILAASSKNDRAIAESAFRDHPDSVLRLDDFAVFNANWDNKADNIRRIADRLNIGLDSIVFVDDNPLERDIVRRHLPEVAVVDLPDDPCSFVSTLAREAWFEAVTFSSEDAERSRYYADNARREAFRETHVNMDAYLQSLDMEATVGEPDQLHLPRIAQLINKSNQFHLTGTRYAEAEVVALVARPGCFVRHFRLRDRFGDNGLIACVVLQHRNQALHMDTWVMSCRVLGRTMEEFILNEVLAIARVNRCTRISGRYVRSSRNGLVSELYPRLGFVLVEETPVESHWAWDIEATCPGWKTWVRSAGRAGGAANVGA